MNIKMDFLNLNVITLIILNIAINIEIILIIIFISTDIKIIILLVKLNNLNMMT